MCVCVCSSFGSQEVRANGSKANDTKHEHKMRQKSAKKTRWHSHKYTHTQSYIYNCLCLCLCACLSACLCAERLLLPRPVLIIKAAGCCSHAHLPYMRLGPLKNVEYLAHTHTHTHILTLTYTHSQLAAHVLLSRNSQLMALLCALPQLPLARSNTNRNRPTVQPSTRPPACLSVRPSDRLSHCRQLVASFQ